MAGMDIRSSGNMIKVTNHILMDNVKLCKARTA